MNIHVVDADAAIHAWDFYYMPSVFPTLWGKLAEKRNSIVMTDVNLGQVTGDGILNGWIRNHWRIDSLDAAANQLALRLRIKYQTQDSGDGADKKDIDLIAYAKQLRANHSVTVVTHEETQTSLPQNKSRYKIPAICRLESLNCIQFPEMIKKLNIVI